MLPTQIVHDREEREFESEEARLRSEEYIGHFFRPNCHSSLQQRERLQSGWRTGPGY